MATQYFYCTQCHKKVSISQRLFDSLLDFSRADLRNCAACGGTRELHVSLDFQLGTGGGDFKVVHAFLPEKLDSWLGEESEEVTYYPFLVVLQAEGDSLAVLLDALLARGRERRALRSACAMPGPDSVRKLDNAGAGQDVSGRLGAQPNLGLVCRRLAMAQIRSTCPTVLPDSAAIPITYPCDPNRRSWHSRRIA